MVDNNTVVFKSEEVDDLCLISSGDLIQINTQETADLIHLLEEQQNAMVLSNNFELPMVKLDHWNKVPDLEEIISEFNFNVELHSKNCGKNSLYSAKLNKVYIRMLQTFTVNINYEPKNVHLFLRAMIVYSLNEEMHNPVVRCNNHRLERNDKHPNAVSHILRCGRRDTEYQGTDDGQKFGDKLSILVPLGKNGYGDVTNETIALEFVCQNSCVSGINRRSTAIIFTLEGVNAEIYGKKVMNFKVCSCPRRDMEKDEEGAIKNQPFPKKRKAGELRHPEGKKPCKVISLPVVKKEKSETLTVPPYVNVESPTPMPHDDLSRTVTFTMPDAESMVFILRQAYNDIVGKMAATTNPDIYIGHARRIKRLMENEEEHLKSLTN